MLLYANEIYKKSICYSKRLETHVPINRSCLINEIHLHEGMLWKFRGTSVLIEKARWIKLWVEKARWGTVWIMGVCVNCAKREYESLHLLKHAKNKSQVWYTEPPWAVIMKWGTGQETKMGGKSFHCIPLQSIVKTLPYPHTSTPTHTPTDQERSFFLTC